jgi:hypothetical protein
MPPKSKIRPSSNPRSEIRSSSDPRSKIRPFSDPRCSLGHLHGSTRPAYRLLHIAPHPSELTHTHTHPSTSSMICKSVRFLNLRRIWILDVKKLLLPLEHFISDAVSERDERMREAFRESGF